MLKKLIASMLAFLLLFSFAGCGSEKDVTITLPASLLEGQNLEEVIQAAKEEGVTDVKENEDGSLSYTMPAKVHREMMDSLKTNLISALNSLTTGDVFTSIKEVSYSDDFTKFTFEVDKEAFLDSLDSFAVFTVVFSSMYYQCLDGVKPEDMALTVDFKDSATEEVFDTKVYPADFETDPETETATN